MVGLHVGITWGGWAPRGPRKIVTKYLNPRRNLEKRPNY